MHEKKMGKKGKETLAMRIKGKNQKTADRREGIYNFEKKGC